MTTNDVLGQYYALIEQGRLGQLLGAFSAGASVNDPLLGIISGKELLESYLREQVGFLDKWRFRPELLNQVKTPARVVTEWVLYFDKGDLPVSLVADISGSGITSLRVYHSTWPLSGRHMVRPGILEPEEGLMEPEIIRQYMRGIGKPDIGLVLSLFADEGYVREPSGSAYRHEGPEGRRAFYSAILANGGIPLRHCTATFDGRCFAVEYSLESWGNVNFQSQAGMAAYELGSDGKIMAARIYDDIAPPHN